MASYANAGAGRVLLPGAGVYVLAAARAMWSLLPPLSAATDVAVSQDGSLHGQRNLPSTYLHVLGNTAPLLILFNHLRT